MFSQCIRLICKKRYVCFVVVVFCFLLLFFFVVFFVLFFFVLFIFLFVVVVFLVVVFFLGGGVVCVFLKLIKLMLLFWSFYASTDPY